MPQEVHLLTRSVAFGLVAMLLSAMHFAAPAQNSVPLELRNFLPSTPQSQAFQKYGDYPVSLATGIPDISIPLYTIQVGSFTYPLSLSYHASGMKPSEVDGIIGLGWNLQGLGRISRSIRGIADERGTPQSYPSIRPPFTPSTSSDIDYMWNAQHTISQTDYEYDIFNISANDLSTKFLLKREAVSTFTPVIIPYQPLMINVLDASLNTMKVVDQEGNQYFFGKNLDNQPEVEQSSSIGDNGAKSGVTTWLLTHIITRSNDVIRFYYQPLTTLNNPNANGTASELIYKVHGYSEFVNVYTNESIQASNCAPGNSWSDPKVSRGNPYNFTTKALTRIETKNETIDFTYSSFEYWTCKLNKISVKNNKGMLMKEIGLQQQNYSSSQRVKLAQVTFTNSRDAALPTPKYSFSYKELGVPSNSEAFLKTIDFWGFYGGGGSGMMHREPGLEHFNIYGDTDRGAYEQSTSVGIIKEIVYPTAGKSVFEFEINKFMSWVKGKEMNAGGLRVQSITNYDNNNQFIGKSVYKYGINEDGRGNAAVDPYDQNTRKKVVRYSGTCYDAQRTTYFSDPFYNLFQAGAPVFYPEVAVYEVDQNGKTNGKTVSQFSFTRDSYHHYYNYNRFPGSNYFDADNFSWFAPRERDKLLFKYENGQHILVKKQHTEYEYKEKGELKEAVFYAQVVSNSLLPYNVELSYYQYSPSCPPEQPGDNYSGSFKVINSYGTSCYPRFATDQRTYYTGAYAVKQTVIDEFQDSRPLTQTEDFTYENRHLKVRTRQITASDKQTVVTRYHYPFDFAAASGSNQSMGKLVSSNMISPVVEELTWKGGNLISGKITDFGDFAGLVLPKTVYALQLKQPLSGIALTATLNTNPASPNANFLRKVAFVNYNGDKPIEFYKEGDVANAFIWDYNNTHLTAQVVNSKAAEVAYTGFETGDKGNWDNISGTYSGTAARTGVQSFSGSLSKAGLTSRHYEIAFWPLTSGSVTINATSTTVTAGVYFRQIIPATTAVSINTNGVLIDDVRLYPQGAQMTTYTYSPLEGMTSATDPNGVSTFYEYDALQRLQNVKDQDKNLLKNYRYYLPARL